MNIRVSRTNDGSFAATISAALLASAIGLIAARADALPLSAQDILDSDPSATDGIYLIDPDGAGGDDAFEAYADMVSFGGGWTLGLNSLAYDKAATSDMTSNTGTVGLNTSHTRDMTHLAILGDAQIRHQIIDNGQVVFDGYYTGNYHGTLAASPSDWVISTGDIYATFNSHNLGREWSTSDNDVDTYSGNCADLYGPWYHGSCWASHPASTHQAYSGPYAGNHGYVDSWRIWVRGPAYDVTTSVPEPSSLALLGLGLFGLALRRRRRA